MIFRVISIKCTGCQKCLKYCPYGAITVVNDKAQINERCTACNNCLDKCPYDAIERDVKTSNIDLCQWRGIWVLAEHHRNRLKKVTYELLGASRALAEKTNEKVSVVLLGYGTDHLIQSLYKYGADIVYQVDSLLLEQINIELVSPILVTMVQRFKPSIILIGGTAYGRIIAPVTAIKLGTGLTADCTNLDVDSNGNLVQIRPAFGGNIMASILTAFTRPQIATIRPNVMKSRTPVKAVKKGSPIKLSLEEDFHITEDPRRVEIVRIVEDDSKVNLEDAEIVVTGGYGLGRPEDFNLVHDLAHILNGTVGASRKVVDLGWISRPHQVGQTGKTVSPRIYIAIGVSGAIQHQLGINSSDIIIAINSDEQAPIFNIADYGIVGNLSQVVPQLIKQLTGVQREK